MEIIPQKMIREWYKEEYSKKTSTSIYGKPVKEMISFFTLLRKHPTVRTVLELGCGDGRNVYELAKRGYTVTGIDLQDRLFSLAGRTKLHLRYIKADITKYKFEKEKYGALIASEVFHLMSRKNVMNTIQRMKQATEESGYIYISILSNLRRYFLETKKEFKYENQADYTSDETRKMLLKEFKQWRMIKLGSFHDEQDWPVKKGNYPLRPYHWSGDYVYVIAQKK